MRYLFTLLMSFAFSLSVAQPVITSSNFFKSGENLTSYFYPATLSAPGISGANVTWDFSAFQSTTNTSISTVTSSIGSPRASNYPTSSLLWIQPASGASAYEYLNTSNANLPLIEGIYTTYSSLPSAYVNIDYSNSPIPVRVYPTTYNTTASGAINAVYTSYTSTDGSGTRIGNYTYTADGYGTLRLSFGSFPNTIRTVLVQNYKDSVYFPDFGYSYYETIKANLTTYTWISQSVQGAVLSLSIYNSTTSTFILGDDLGDTPSQLISAYSNVNTSNPTGIVSPSFENSPSVSIFPNPSNSELNIVVNNNIPIDQIDFRLIDGKLVKTFPGFVSVNNLQVADLPRGIYVVELYQGSKKSYFKVSLI